ncbi:hypothetical protein EAH89_28745 [Roseomonas nepalensis]|uniref:Uncharacterized protein n=1 Tax=Muricoccus nepalensis TaxID=1854500 RepID=A0A502EYK3_9PROT|nr:hypothetical protein [Roseomonas nepalensis]TPG41476.1 hypothetical protein EAH89_28745 [Roseomonas nepalensis]
MTQRRLLYESESGDRWFLLREPEPERVFVRHEPSSASGGRVADLEIGEFLIRGVYGPEHVELLRLVGSLVDQQGLTTEHTVEGE